MPCVGAAYAGLCFKTTVLLGTYLIVNKDAATCLAEELNRRWLVGVELGVGEDWNKILQGLQKTIMTMRSASSSVLRNCTTWRVVLKAEVLSLAQNLL